MLSSPSGVFCALVTPLAPDGGIDPGGLERLVTRVLAGGAHGICPVGTTGEGSRLLPAQRDEMVARVRALVPDSTPVIPTPSAGGPAETLAEIERFASLGADAALVPVPRGYALSGTEVDAFYQQVASASPIPLVLYNIPWLTGVTIPPEVIGSLARLDKVIAVKDSSGDFAYVQQVLDATQPAESFSVLTGTDTMVFATTAVGGQGTIAGSVNLVPSLVRALYDAATARDWDHARRLQASLSAVVAATSAPGFPHGWKAALEMVGVCSGRPAAPAQPLAGPAHETLRRALQATGVLDAGGAPTEPPPAPAP